MTRKEVLKMIAEDMTNDAHELDDQLFNGRTMAKYFGYSMAAIVGLAKINYSMIEDIERLENEVKRLSNGPIKYKGVKND